MRAIGRLTVSTVATGLALITSAGAVAADESGPGPQPGTPLACDTDGVTVSDYLIDDSASGRFRSSGVTITDIDPACAGLTLAATIRDRAGAPLAQGSADVPARTGPVEIIWDEKFDDRPAAMEDIEAISVSLVEPVAKPDGPHDGERDESGDTDEEAGTSHPDDELPGTGADAIPLALLGAGLLGMGTGVVMCARRRANHLLSRFGVIRGRR